MLKVTKQCLEMRRQWRGHVIIHSEHMEKAKVNSEMGRVASGTNWMKDEVSTGAKEKEYQMKRSLYHVLPSL